MKVFGKSFFMNILLAGFVFFFLKSGYTYSDVARQTNGTITFVGTKALIGDGVDPSTMDYYEGERGPHLSVLIPYLRKHGSSVEVLAWEDETIDWQTKGKIILAPVWGYMQNLDKFLKWLDLMEKKGVNLVNHPTFLKWDANKIYLLDLPKRNISIPHTLIVNGESSLSFEEAQAQFYEKFHQTDIVIKGLMDAGADGYMHVKGKSLDKVREHFENLKKNNRGVLVQNFMPEVKKKGEFSFAFFGDRLSHFYIKVPKSDDERVQSWYGGKSFPLSIATVKEQLNFIKAGFRPDFELEENDVVAAYQQVHEIYNRLLLLLDDLSIPHPKYIRMDSVMVNKNLVIMELEGLDPYLEMQEAMEYDPSNNVVENYIKGVMGED